METVNQNAESRIRNHSLGVILKGWSPFLLASIFIFVCGMPSLNQFLKFSSLTLPMPGLHEKVIRVAPVAPKPTPEAAILDLNVFALPGSAVFAGALLAAPFLGLSPGKVLKIFGNTLRQLIPSLLAITFMVSLAFVTRYSGMDTTLGLSLTHTGWVYPLFGTLLGWLGVALTGTDAGSNALFENLQRVTAEQLNISPILMGAANTTGGVMGKMIDAQSIGFLGSRTVFRRPLRGSGRFFCIPRVPLRGYCRSASPWATIRRPSGTETRTWSEFPSFAKATQAGQETLAALVVTNYCLALIAPRRHMV